MRKEMMSILCIGILIIGFWYCYPQSSTLQAWMNFFRFMIIGLFINGSVFWMLNHVFHMESLSSYIERFGKLFLLVMFVVTAYSLFNAIGAIGFIFYAKTFEMCAHLIVGVISLYLSSCIEQVYLDHF